ncbi:MAG: RsbRD N-terminal domain-containing protein, partial [Longimicrobiales bacterium]
MDEPNSRTDALKPQADLEEECPLAARLAAEMRSARTEIVERWLERIAARVSIDANQIFPTQDLLDHVPLLVDGIADYVESPADEITADIPIVAKAMELGRMRHDQGFDVHEILKEYEILGGIMFHQVGSIIEQIDEPCTRTEMFMCA